MYVLPVRVRVKFLTMLTESLRLDLPIYLVKRNVRNAMVKDILK